MKFKLFGRLSKGKPVAAKDAPHKGPRRDAHQMVDEMRARGVVEADMIRALKEEGYSFKEIDDTLNESLRDQVTGAGPQMNMQQGQQMDDYGAQDFAPMGAEHDDFMSMDQQNMNYSGMDQMNDPSQQCDICDNGQGNVGSADEQQRENIYEIVESVVNERVNSLKSEIKEIDTQIKSIQQIISEFKTNVADHNESMRKELGDTHEKIKDNRNRLSELEPKVAGLERAFKDIVPNLVDSVRDVKEYVSAQVGEVPPHKHGRREEDIFEDDSKFSEPEESGKKKSEDVFDDPLRG